MMICYDQRGNEIAISRDDEQWLDESFFSVQQAKLPTDAPRAAAAYRATYQGRKNKREIPVKDLEIDPDEAAWVREVFERVAYEGTSGYALAQELTARGIRTRTGAIFRANNVLRIIRHEGYTGYLQTKEAKSDYIPTLKIVDDALFAKANEVISRRSTKLKESKNIAHDSENPTLLAGMVYCAHCGAKMSGFLHKDSYKLKDGTVRTNTKAKYDCFQRGQKLRDCNGQQLYIAERVDEIVLAVTRKILAGIKDEPYSENREQQLKQACAEQRDKLKAAARRIKELEHAQEGYEGEILKSIEGPARSRRRCWPR